MTPLEMEILVHYIAHARDYRDGDFSAPAVRDTINQFRDVCGLLEYEPDKSVAERIYRLSERGRVFTEAVLAMPLPVQIWRMPQPEPTNDSR